MNKTRVLAAIKEKTGLSDEQVSKINDVLDEHFIIGNKDKIKAGLMDKLGVDEAKADEIYNAVMSVFGEGIADKIKHPFKKED